MLVELLIKLLESAGENRRQPSQQPQWTWEQQQAWEAQQREWQARQIEALPQQQQGPPAMPPPVPGARPARRQRVSVAPPPLPEDVPVARLVSPPGGGADADVRPAAAAARPAADAVALNRWMRPATLRSQFVLTEILKPPLALRPPRV